MVLLATSKAWWDKLPADARTGFQEALKVATTWNWENTGKENAEAYAQLEKAGKKVYDLTPEQRAQWIQAVQPVWKEFGDNVVGPEVMARLREIDAKARIGR